MPLVTVWCSALTFYGASIVLLVMVTIDGSAQYCSIVHKLCCWSITIIPICSGYWFGCYWNNLIDSICASPSSGEAYRDRRLTSNFELKFFVCRHVSIWGFQNRVCLYPEKRNHLSFVNISPTLEIDTSMERSSRVLHHGNPKICIKKYIYIYICLTECFCIHIL